MVTCLTAKGYCHGFGDNKNCYGNEMTKFKSIKLESEVYNRQYISYQVIEVEFKYPQKKN